MVQVNRVCLNIIFINRPQFLVDSNEFRIVFQIVLGKFDESITMQKIGQHFSNKRVVHPSYTRIVPPISSANCFFNPPAVVSFVILNFAIIDYVLLLVFFSLLHLPNVEPAHVAYSEFDINSIPHFNCILNAFFAWSFPNGINLLCFSDFRLPPFVSFSLFNVMHIKIA